VRRPTTRFVLSVVGSLALLIAAGTALAAGTTLRLRGPSGTLNADTRYTVTASGSASHSYRLFAYEGGEIGGARNAIGCYSTQGAEYARYKPSANVHVYLGSYSVDGSFSRSWTLVARNPGPRSFCAYLASSSGNKTYAHASLHWTNRSGT
jgi:hypothetical protein